MEPIKIERKEEITIQWADIRGAVESIFYDFGFDIDQISNEAYIIDEILTRASVVDLDDDAREVWRDLIDNHTWDMLIDSFWKEYKAYGCDKFATLTNEIKEIIKKRL